MLDDQLKNNAPYTPSLTIRDAHFVEVAKLYLEACNRVTDPAMDVPRSDQFQSQVASGDGSAIRV